MKPTLVLFVIFALGFQARGQIPSVELEKQLDEVVPAILQRTGTPSASIAVVRDARTTFVKAYGRSRLAPETPATSILRYGIGSITKQITAGAMLLLVQGGKLMLDDRVSKYLPDLPNSSSVPMLIQMTMWQFFPKPWWNALFASALDREIQCLIHLLGAVRRASPLSDWEEIQFCSTPAKSIAS